MEYMIRSVPCIRYCPRIIPEDGIHHGRYSLSVGRTGVKGIKSGLEVPLASNQLTDHGCNDGGVVAFVRKGLDQPQDHLLHTSHVLNDGGPAGGGEGAEEEAMGI